VHGSAESELSTGLLPEAQPPQQVTATWQVPATLARVFSKSARPSQAAPRLCLAASCERRHSPCRGVTSYRTRSVKLARTFADASMPSAGHALRACRRSRRTIDFVRQALLPAQNEMEARLLLLRNDLQLPSSVNRIISNPEEQVSTCLPRPRGACKAKSKALVLCAFGDIIIWQNHTCPVIFQVAECTT